MLFSQQYNIARKHKKGWFDPILDHDTKLFIDPFLIFKTKLPSFRHCHRKTIDFFRKAFQLAAQSGGRSQHLAHKKLLNMLVFPEASEVCLGYAGSTEGSGTGKGFSKIMTAAFLESVSRGITEFTHFEEIGLINEGIGCDRISDITVNILKPELIKYTQEICLKLGIPMRRCKIRHVDFDFKRMRWEDGNAKLPLNPYAERAVILVPAAFLRKLPVVSAEEFWNYLWENKNDQMRDDYNFEIKSQVNKKEIIALARENRFLVREYLQNVEKSPRVAPYDLDRDASGFYKWDQSTTEFVGAHPLRLAAKNRKEFIADVDAMIEQYQLFVEDNAGYKLLWDEGLYSPKSEEAAQLLFLGIVKNYCRANNIDISRETNIGRGPVDFKFSSGYENRSLLEVKLAKNGRFWRGLSTQLPQYLKSESIKLGYYLVIAYNEKDFKRLSSIKRKIAEASKNNNVELKAIIVDATTDKPSASKQ